MSTFDTVWNKVHVHASQAKAELRPLFDAVVSLQPRVILEIGTSSGGTGAFWDLALGGGGLFITLDMGSTVHRNLFGTGNDLHFLIGNSTHPETLANIQTILAGQLVDFLFIDGDHSYEGVKSDFQMYSPLVRAGGIIGMHDTNHVPVKTFWNEIPFPNKRTIDAGYGMGIIQL